MPEVTIVYWRDIPAQVIVGRGRGGAKAPLSERFEKAIDRCAMAIGAKDSDAYLAEWRKAASGNIDGSAEVVLRSEVERLEAAYDDARLKHLITHAGWD
ncbi:virulence factor [Tropicimonas aquimaris]|uniref:Virulence factor n=1 Tax=Tropicimonas aquimaris TaxID=914152 RepID=A0ABW3IQ38_9RHOB